MRIVLIYRRKQHGAYSIERIFHTIANELRQSVEVIEYETGTRWDTLRDVWQLRQMRADIYHLTGGVSYFVPFLPPEKTVLTIHDIGHYLFGLRGLKRCVYKWLWLLWPIRAARAVTAVSGETRDSIVRHLAVAGDRVETIENCHGALFQPTPRTFDAACPVILQVGTQPYKNVPRLIEALSGIPCRLVLIGALDAPLVSKLAECGVDYVNCVNLTHEEIHRQYLECDIVSFVSTGEGFGLPIIEAQAIGRPLITSSVPPMRDVAGDGACLVDPLEVSQIRQGILRVIADSDYRRQLVERGLDNAAGHSPQVVSRRYLDLYRRIACS